MRTKEQIVKYQKDYHASLYKEHTEEIKERNAQWVRENPEKQKVREHRWGQDNLIRVSLRSHHHWIFNDYHPCHSVYVGMPFCDRWNPDKGGSFATGQSDLLAEIGPRPTDGKYHLHVIIKSRGIVPGNLMWMPVGQHRREELVCKQAVEIVKLQEEIAKLKRIDHEKHDGSN